MKAMAWLRQRPKAVASTAALTIAGLTVTTLAFAYEGNPTTQVDLNDGGVWVTKSESLQVGHFNNESTVLDGAVVTTSDSFDVMQDKSNIIVTNYTQSTLTRVDPGLVAITDTAGIPAAAKVVIGANTVAILDTDGGNLWVQPMAGLAGFDVKAAETTAELGKGADVTVGQDGTVYALNSEKGEIVTIQVDAEGAVLASSAASIGELEAAAQSSITVVGQTPVVLSPADGEVISPRGNLRAKITGADTAVLQQPSVDAEFVTVATATQLIEIPFNGDEPELTTVAGQGAPAAPVNLLGCTYGAWSGSSQFARNCAGTNADVLKGIPNADESKALVFRVNRNVIILNDSVNGNAWLADESLQQVDNWDDLTPPEGDNSEEEDETTEETVETELPNRTEINTPPVAENDDFGVRPGQTTLLSITDNDNDADGDVLVATVEGDQPSIGEVVPIYDGAALQIAVPEDATGSATFTYKIDDGRENGTDTAEVTVTVHDWETNAPPEMKRTTVIAVEAGGTVSYNVLPDWGDRDGDDVYLRGVTPAPGDEVDFTTDGQITYKAVSSLQGRKEIEVVVSDALGEQTVGKLVIDVRPAGSTVPKTNADHVVTHVNQEVTVTPLVNDTSSGAEPLRLSRVDEAETPGATVVPDYPNKTFTFKAPAAGVYYVQYLVTAGPASVPGLVRIDVREPSDEELAPIAVRDVVLLPTGGETLYGVLGNDTDPNGGILVVQSVKVEPGSGISVSILNHETLRIGDQGSLDEQVRLTYTISNGIKTATADVIVIPIPPPNEYLPPIAVEDEAIVRVGDVVTIPVLDNDVHPNGDAMHVAPELIEPFVDPEAGEIFVTQDTVRFRASEEPGTVYATYEVVDSRGQKAAGYITIQVLPRDDENNAAPNPRDVTARTVSGTTVNIPIPLDGLDEDGDSVELLNIASSPTKGRVVEVAQTYIVYEAFKNSTGLDTFTYTVRDRLGAEATAQVSVGIAPPEAVNQAPYAVKDSIVVRPGREVSVPALLNDSDPEGELPALVEDGLEVPDVEGLEARVSGDRVLIQAPNEAMETSVQYMITDSHGATATAVIQVTVDPDVPLLAPIARDDRLRPEDLEDGQLTAELDILANDEDPDGTTDSLEIEVEEGATLLSNRNVEVEVTDQLQVIRYTITDQDGLATSSYIFVPALLDLRPSLISTEPVVVEYGETKVLPLADYVQVAGGGSVVVTEAEKVVAQNSNGAGLVQDERTLVYTPAEGFSGQDAITFEVTDGTGPDDPEGRKATLQMPITVLPQDNQSPEFVSSELTVAPGEEPVTLDLQGLTSDEDEGDTAHEFTLVQGGADGIDISLDGATLVASAGTNVTKGTVATATIRVSDGTSEPVEGTVTVTVSASTRDLPVATTDTVAEAPQGQPVTVPVLANDFNPFPDTPLKIVSAVSEQGEASIDVGTDSITITPGADYVGTVVVRYRIQDATADVDREVDGQVIVTVQGRPEAPGAPTVTQVEDRMVALTWSAPQNNGAEITGYTVTSASGPAYSKQCASTTCTLDGLTNNQEYTFQVVAINKVGTSDPSAPSAVARPDVRPDKPAAPTLVFGDKKLTVNWTTPNSEGSPVKAYNLEISPAPASGGGATKSSVTGNTVEWTGLTNGTAYTVRVQAINDAPDPSEWSEYSAQEVPAGPPLPAAAPTTSELQPVGNRAQMLVQWGEQDNNGDSIDQYQLEVLRGGVSVQVIPVAAGARQQAVVVDTSETNYTFRIMAQNKAGWGEWSAPSAERRGVIPPGAPTAVTAKEGDRTLSVTYQPGPANGARAGEISYQYSLNGGAWSSNWDGANLGGLQNGTSYSVQVRAVSTVAGSTYVGAPSAASNAVVPYGPVRTPGAKANASGTSITFDWSAPAENGRKITQVQIRIDGGGWENVNNNGSRTNNYGYSQKHTIEVRAQDAAGQWSGIASASATTVNPPQPVATTSRGAKVKINNQYGTCTTVSCGYVVLNVKDFKAGNYRLSCIGDGQQFASTQSFYVPANGSVQLDCIWGHPGTQVYVQIEGGNPARSQSYTWPSN